VNIARAIDCATIFTNLAVVMDREDSLNALLDEIHQASRRDGQRYLLDQPEEQEEIGSDVFLNVYDMVGGQNV
jgi:hypothetical protein